MSVAKPLIIAEAIDKGGVNAQDLVDCGNGTYDVEGTIYKDWQPFGEISVTKIIAESSNIGAIKIANAFGGAPLISPKRRQCTNGGSDASFPMTR
jgi:cell division protein FtsI (penicillin-binding protein 3)